MNNTFKNILLSILVSIGVVGCGTTPYKQPEKSDNATLDFSTAPNILGFMFYENADECSGNMSLTDEQNPIENKSKTLVLEANKRVGFNFIVSPNPANPLITLCNYTMSFKPQSNGRYGIKTNIDYRNNRFICTATLFDKNKADQPVEAAVDVKQMRFVMGLGLRNKCVPVEHTDAPAK